MSVLGSLTVDSPLQLLSATSADRARVAEERAKRRREREADGFTPAEIHQLEQDDAERERLGTGNVLKEVVECHNAVSDQNSLLNFNYLDLLQTDL